MFRQLDKALAVILGLGLVLAPTPPAAAQTASFHRIVAIGDLHGDAGAWREIAKTARLIDDHGHWAGGRTVLVQIGDVVDRGPQSLDIIKDLMRLQREAPRSGGRVVALVGNHEAMNMTGDLRYVSAEDYAAFVTPNSARRRDEAYAANRARVEAAAHRRAPGLDPETIRRDWLAAVPLGWIEHQRAWAPDGMIGRWVIANPAVVVVDGVLFVHGGISPVYSRLSLARINQRVAVALSRGDTGDTGPDAILEDPMGPLWFRGLAAKPGEAGAVSEPDVDHMLAAYGVRFMVIGHTPNLSGIVTGYQGQVIRIDTGISAVYGGKLSYLEIIEGEPVTHDLARSASSQ